MHTLYCMFSHMEKHSNTIFIHEITAQGIIRTTDKLQKRAMAKYLQKKGASPKEIREDMIKITGDDSPSYATVNGGLLTSNRTAPLATTNHVPDSQRRRRQKSQYSGRHSPHGYG